LKHPGKRLTYANVMSTLAVFLVLGGATAFAAGLGKNSVGPKQLKRNAVTSSKIKNGAVTEGKIAASARAALQGPQGLQGPVGPRGPSNGRASSVQGNTEIGLSEAEPAIVDSLALGAGKWLVVAETGISNISTEQRSAVCSLSVASKEIGRTRVLDAAAATQISGDATVLGAADLPSGGTVRFLCWADGDEVYVPVDSRPAIQAVQVETLAVD